MGSARPELIFLEGPQAGERAVLMTNVVLLGRAANADVRLKEEAASREHVRFQLTADGWLMESISANGTFVNRKRYKRKKLLLDTGDVLGVGLETVILYVAPGDDPEVALAAYREAHPAPKPAPESPKRSKKAKADDAPPAEQDKATPKPANAKQAPPAEEDAEAGEDETEPTSKLKYVLFGVVLLGTVLFGVALIVNSLREPGGSGGSGLPRLSDAQITAALSEQFERTPSRTKAAESLAKAVQMYANRVLWEPGDLYRCAKNFKLHRAYRQSRSFAKIEHERMAEKATRDLDKLIREKYDAAWKFEKARSWRNAKVAFEELLIVLPVAELDKTGSIYQVIIKGNVIRHLNYIKQNIGQVKEY